MSTPRHLAPRKGDQLRRGRPPVRLALHQNLMSMHRRLGRPAFIAISTISSVLLSLVASTVFGLIPNNAMSGVDTREVVFSIFVAILVPLLVAPPVTWLLSAVLRELEQTIERLEVLANTDDLTGALNRRGFLQEAERLMAGGGNRGTLVLAMVDLDKFKQLNDRHGHEAGDQALLVLAEQLRHVGGTDGVIGRLGGDEFAMMVHVAAADALSDFVRRLHVACRRIPVRALEELSASFGYTVVDVAAGVDAALGQADRELYLMKARRDPVQPRHLAEVTDMGTFSRSRAASWA